MTLIDPEPIFRTILQAVEDLLPRDVELKLSGGGRGTSLRLTRQRSNGFTFRVVAFPFGVGTWLPLSAVTKHRMAVVGVAESLQHTLSDLTGNPWPAAGVKVATRQLADGVEVWYATPDGSRLGVAQLLR